MHTGESAINRGLAKRLDQLANERERREKAARAEDENFSVEFLSAARKVFEMIDVDESGTLEKAEMSARSVRRVWGGSYAIDAHSAHRPNGGFAPLRRCFFGGGAKKPTTSARPDGNSSALSLIHI